MKQQQNPSYVPVNASAFKARSRRNGWECNLTTKRLNTWWRNTPDACVYCGITTKQYIIIRDIVMEYHGDDWEINRFKRFFSTSIQSQIARMTVDRKDTMKGYTIKNMAKACWICNALKSNFFSEEDMYLISKRVMTKLRAAIAKNHYYL